MIINIIYASTSGNVEAVCEKVNELLNSAGHTAILHRAEKTEMGTLINSEFLILATSTWEHGELNPFFKNLYDSMSESDLSKNRAAFIGLGDKRYEPVLFCEAIEILKRRFIERNGIEVGETLKINGEPFKFLDTEVTDWTKSLINKLTNE